MKKYLVKFLPHLAVGFFFSLFINLLNLSYILYLRNLFDKVIRGSGGGETLFFLTSGVIGAYILMGILDVIRSKLLVRTGVKFDQVVAGKVFERMIDNSKEPGSSKHTQGLKDLNSIRNFMGGTGIFAFFDAPWVPIFLALVFVFHSWLGYVACAGALLLFLLVVAQEILTSRMKAAHSQSAMATDQFLSSTMRNAQTVNAMGMLPALTKRWKTFNNKDVYYEDKLAGRTGFFQSMSKCIMMSTVILVMSTGAYLVVLHEITLGTMVAASMFMGRALAPIMMLGTAWQSLVESRIAYKRLNEMMDDRHSRQGLPVGDKPDIFEVVKVNHSIAGEQVLEDISFRVNPGEILAIIGPSGAGKSTLARIILGLWKPDSGEVKWGGRDVFKMDKAMFGEKIGYVPQEVELFSGTVAENISRLNDVDSPGIVTAAREAQAHEMILGFPKGYDTLVGTGGIALSGGQKQRVIMARALYGDPWMVVLDEPDSHLDQPGRENLTKILRSLKKNGKLLILISHNQDLSKIADKILTLNRGKIQKIENSDKKVLPENNG